MDLPVFGTITQYFNTPVNYIKGRTLHEAIDIVTIGNAPIMAPCHGFVTKIINNFPDVTILSNEDHNYGNEVWMKRDDGDEYRFCHCKPNSFRVTIGQEVQISQTLALTGQSGYHVPATCIHVHYEQYHNGVRVDPLDESNQLNEDDMTTEEKQMQADHEKAISAIFVRLDNLEVQTRNLGISIDNKFGKPKATSLFKKLFKRQ